MLSRPQEFSAILELGTVRSTNLINARFLRTNREVTRFGLATGRRIGGAVVRNRVRRRLREALRERAGALRPGWDILIMARPAVVGADRAALVGSLDRILERGGVLEGVSAS